jgi:hypothetical protein
MSVKEMQAKGVTKVLINRASEGTLSGRVDMIGVAVMEVVTVKLGTRIVRQFGNGTPTPIIQFESEMKPKEKYVDCVMAGDNYYVLQPVAFKERYGHIADHEITIRHDEDVRLMRKEEEKHTLYYEEVTQCT